MAHQKEIYFGDLIVSESRIMNGSNPSPDCPKAAPYSIEVKEGESYLWCSCGKSTKQPFCDGSHKNSDFHPISYTAPKTRRVFFCGCKLTKRAPLCDGEHAKLK